ncbi:MAG TPA: hypothetical protein VGC77_04040 [Rhodopseudomonas sp.]|uniref:hypothetical protein n=1 Tax=Rhodopseudomonas sp. TaxID=1078 RepID=UPI002ED9AC35
MPNELSFVGPDRGHEALEKARSLHHADNKSDREVITWFYGVLSILDAKANGLLRVNASFITILLFFLGAANAKDNPNTQSNLFGITKPQVTTAELVLGLVLASTFLCFLIVRVNWKFLGQVRRRKGGPYDFESEAERLANVVDDRTHYYLIAWLLTLAAAAVVVLFWVQTALFKLE